MTAKHNTNENVKAVINARIDSREILDMVSKVAHDMVDNGSALPEEFEGVFAIEIFTRPSGSKYAVVNFA